MIQDIEHRHNLLDIIETDEYGLYSGGWTKKELTPESFSHPAKISRKLIRWIYDHAIEEGWLKPGDVVLDPFFGIGGCALDGMAEGAIVIGVELERHFCDMSAGCDCTGISQEDFDEFKGHYEKHYRIPQRCDIQFNPLKMSWERGRESAFAFDATEMVEWLCEYEDEADDIFDALVEYDVWVPGNFDAHRYEGERHWCPACVAAAKKAERDEKSGNGTDQMDMFSLIAPEWFTQPHHYEGNTERWKRWGLPGRAICLQGDSRELVKVLGKVNWAELAAGSPPYSEGLGHSMRKERQIDIDKGLYMAGGKLAYGESEGQLSVMPEGTLVASSPAFGTAEIRDRSPVQDGEVASAMSRAYTQSKQGESEGNLAGMEMGDLATGSPPMQQTLASGEAARKLLLSNYRTRETQGTSEEAIGRLETRFAGDYGQSEGQLGAMPPGDISISSSPFAQSIGSDDPDKRGGLYRDPKRAQDVNLAGTYGEAEGQLASMAVGSSPYINSMNSPQKCGIDWEKTCRPDRAKPSHGRVSPQVDGGMNYGTEEGQLGAMPEGQLGIEQGDTFWSAARLILLQLHQVLRPGAHCIWVTKPFVRNKQIVDFPGQWRQLNESCGFRLLHRHVCWQIERGAVQLDFDGKEHQDVKERISFFRRLYNKKYPKNAINWEIVDCFERV